jgi:hypothetical protein
LPGQSKSANSSRLTSMPRSPSRVTSLLAGGHRGDRLRRGGAGRPVPGREPQERPQGAQFLLDGLGLVSGQRGGERLNRPGVTAGEPAARAGERGELRGQRRGYRGDEPWAVIVP